MAIEEETVLDTIEISPETGTAIVRWSTYITRDGERDPAHQPRVHTAVYGPDDKVSAPDKDHALTAHAKRVIEAGRTKRVKKAE